MNGSQQVIVIAALARMDEKMKTNETPHHMAMTQIQIINLPQFSVDIAKHILSNLSNVMFVVFCVNGTTSHFLPVLAGTPIVATPTSGG